MIDDRPDVRDSVVLAIELELPTQGWRVIGADPLPSLDDYPQWLRYESVGVLVLDEKLQEQKGSSGGEFAAYNGHDVARFLRGRGFQIPIYAVTAYSDASEVEATREHFDNVHSRQSFLQRPSKLVPSFLRSGRRFLEQFEEELAQFTELSAKTAAGTASQEEKTSLKALQAKLGTAFSMETEQARIDALDSLENKLDELDVLKTQIEKSLQVVKK